MSLFRSYAKFKIGQRIFRAVRDMMRGRSGTASGAGRRRSRV
jgi:hypothetical protein